MLRRYPHTATLVVCTESDQDDGIPITSQDTFEIEGRFEPAANKSDNIDYKAKYYCQNFEYLLKGFIEAGVFPTDLFAHDAKKDLKPFSVDGQTLIYRDKKFEIILLHNYQTHCEIWLE